MISVLEANGLLTFSTISIEVDAPGASGPAIVRVALPAAKLHIGLEAPTNVMFAGT